MGKPGGGPGRVDQRFRFRPMEPERDRVSTASREDREGGAKNCQSNHRCTPMNMFTDVHLWLRSLLPVPMFASSRESPAQVRSTSAPNSPGPGLDGLAGLATFSAPVWTSG